MKKHWREGKERFSFERKPVDFIQSRSLPTDFLHSGSCMHCPSNTPMTTGTRSISSSSSSTSSSTSTKSCTCITDRSNHLNRQPQRSQSSPARPSSIIADDSKRVMNKQKVHVSLSFFLDIINHRRSFL